MVKILSIFMSILTFTLCTAASFIGSSGGGLASLNALTGSTQTFATGTSGTDFGISSSSTTHTFNLPSASSSNRGLVTTGAQTFAGDKTFSGATTLQGRIGFTGIISPAQITADQNNYNPTGFATAETIRLSSDATRNITGLTAGTDGDFITIFNIGSFNIVLNNEHASSTAANRFALNSDITLLPNHSVRLSYDGTSARWRVLRIGPSVTESFVSIGNTSGLTNERALTGTANQITITDGGANSTATIGFATNPVLTSPKIVTSLFDTNGNTLMGVTATGSAVNAVTVANAATGNAPEISATGSDTNIALKLTPKGTGTITLSGPVVNPTNGAASTPAKLMSGTWFTGGSSTTTKPQLLVEPSGTTSTGWSTSGTGVGINAPTGFNGNAIDIQLAGTQQTILRADGVLAGDGFHSRVLNVYPTQANALAQASGSRAIRQSSANGIEIVGDIGIVWSSNTAGGDAHANSDTHLRRGGVAATVQLGVDAASPIAQTFKAHNGSGTDKAGADLILQSGNPTGSGAQAALKVKTAYAGSTGSSQQTPTDRLIIAPAKTLTDAQTNLFEIALSAGQMTGGTIKATIEASDGTDMQAFSQICTYSAVNKGGSYTTNITCDSANDSKSVSAGTLTTSWAVTGGTNKVTISVTPTGSLTETTYRVSTIIEQNAPRAITLL